MYHHLTPPHTPSDSTLNAVFQLLRGKQYNGYRANLCHLYVVGTRYFRNQQILFRLQQSCRHGRVNAALLAGNLSDRGKRNRRVTSENQQRQQRIRGGPNLRCPRRGGRQPGRQLPSTGRMECRRRGRRVGRHDVGPTNHIGEVYRRVRFPGLLRSTTT
jgi:hypothetical protein